MNIALKVVRTLAMLAKERCSACKRAQPQTNTLFFYRVVILRLIVYELRPFRVCDVLFESTVVIGGNKIENKLQKLILKGKLGGLDRRMVEEMVKVVRWVVGKA